jgi:hypothetical protein
MLSAVRRAGSSEFSVAPPAKDGRPPTGPTSMLALALWVVTHEQDRLFWPSGDRELENPGIRFPEACFARDDNGIEQSFDAQRLQLQPLRFARSVRDRRLGTDLHLRWAGDYPDQP